MSERRKLTIDANEAVTSVAHRTNEVIAIYPITPASPMGEFADQWSAEGRKNLWGVVPEVMEMQSEGGAAGAVHGALQAGSLTTTFTASQGLLLMVPNLYKIAGELNPFVLHVAARTVATHALSIFGDHSDVMACRQTGFALLAAGSVQEAHDFAAIAQAATLESRVPFLHFFDGFRTSHEIAKVEELTDDDLRNLLSEAAIKAHRERALTPDRPVLRGTAQNPDTFFQAREACNPFYLACPEKVQKAMDLFAGITGRAYRLFDYIGHPEAERVVVLMGSGAEVAHEAVEWLVGRGEKVGLLKVRLYRPWDAAAFLGALPPTVRGIAVLDRTKEPGALGDPLYLDVVTTLAEARIEGRLPLAAEPRVVAGRYGLSSKEFTPAMVKAVLDNLAQEKPRNHFTIGIVDDVTHLSLPYDHELDIEPDDVRRCVFFGLGSDGTVGANKNSIKIIGEETENYAQGYFVYDSKKAGAITISHLRFGPRTIRSSYLIRQANFVACHQTEFLDKYEMAELAAPGGIFLLNSPHSPETVWDSLPREVQEQIIAKGLKLYVIDAYAVAREAGLGVRINTIMQVCFFAISGVLPREEAIAKIKEAIEKTYGKRGKVVIEQNFAAVDAALAHLHEVRVPATATATRHRPPIVSEEAPEIVQRVSAVMLANKGDLLPVSAFPVDGTWPTGTTQWEKRNIALEIPIWDPKVCIQCNQCVFVCPHAALRAKVYEPEQLAAAPASFLSMDYKAGEFKGMKYTLQVAPEDCTGCTLCVNICPAKDRTNPRRKAINMEPQREHRERERENYRFFLDLPEVDRTKVTRLDTKGSQFLQPLFEYSGACAGCGETPYIKLLTQLYGDRLLVANATGCSSIYGANLPTTPYTKNRDGRGPAWSNSLFEDNAEFGFGFRLAVDAHARLAGELLQRLAGAVGDDLVTALLNADQSDEAGLAAQRERVAALKARLATLGDADARRLELVADYLVKKSVWLVGGDGWAYDIGFGGLDHVLAQRRDINILVLDTEVYSNTGGQASKATPLGAAAKFAMAGKEVGKKDLGLLAMSYGHVYVARVAFGSKYNQTVEAIREAESYPGPSLVIAYSHCIAHGYDLQFGVDQQRLAVDSGIWPLYRFDPRRVASGQPPLKLDSGAAKVPVSEYMKNEARFRMVEKQNPQRFRQLMAEAQRDVTRRVAIYEQLSHLTVPSTTPAADAAKGDEPAEQ
ncbi:MAG: pyruvate:ferredoxin (flavodoxin) oxidoreductase [Acidobacteria bacterium]|nr:pyruvate:ferredoxin (flavodoxin) oxidoreductase [Thermoanaerobaculia bacterium]MDI9630367.1 pyruvate:ferredoxin (flavodoxin) oxidoreductase [Acidobacteriota bacterium]MBP7812589.1 pyruvate:ferredoxin (flavodoxin) oxidoreductase [Thermoanaerobaculia bacterium]MBP8844707.1 pyruvate:ferredoxin (flavodoxin) oxidoreductase [Thermoanaerobaculia bacterium]NLN12551.1 pyruvate:ferredoxin (flavodoxin) oxidoreductase [Acidobacteriota bacterium]